MSETRTASDKAKTPIQPSPAPRVPRLRWPFVQQQPARDLAPMAAEVAAAPDLPLPAPRAWWGGGQ